MANKYTVTLIRETEITVTVGFRRAPGRLGLIRAILRSGGLRSQSTKAAVRL